MSAPRKKKSTKKRKMVRRDLPTCDGGGMAMFVEDEGILAAMEAQASPDAVKLDIDKLLSAAIKGDYGAVKILRGLDIASLSDWQLKKLLPWFVLSEADVKAICQLIEEELQGIDTRN